MKSNLFIDKVRRILLRKIDSLVGSFLVDIDEIIEAMSIRPFELYLELTNVCNAKCIFCPYQFQERPHEFMSDEVFYKAVNDFVEISGGSVSLTPIVGDVLIDPKFLERVRYLRSLPEIDRISLTTNGILLDRFGVEEILSSGITTINISTSGFEKNSYKRIYRTSTYERMRSNVTELIKKNSQLGSPVNVSIGLRTDRSLDDVMKDPDFQPILKYNPQIDFTWSFTSAGNRITEGMLPQRMKLRKSPPKKEICVNLLNGPMVLPNGNVLGCSCVAAMDAIPDLLIGNIFQDNLLDIWVGNSMRELKQQFSPLSKSCGLNPTCNSCDMYRDLELYRTKEGSIRSDLNRKRFSGQEIKRPDKAKGIFAGG